MFEVWSNFWYAGGSAVDLAFARILIIGYYLFFKLNDRAFDLWAWQRARENFIGYWKRPWLLEILRVPIVGTRTGYALVAIYKLSLFCACIGFYTQAACWLSLVLGIYIMGLRHGLKLHHTVIPIHFAFLAFALAPSGQVFSVDAWLEPSSIWTDSDAMRAQWALQTIRTTFAFVIFSTAVAKIRNIGRVEGFVAPKNLATIIRIHDYPYFYVAPLISIGKLLLRYPWMERFASLSTVVIELSFPLVLFSGVAQLILVPSMIFFLIGFRVFMGPRFDVFSICLIAIFTPWQELMRLF